MPLPVPPSHGLECSTAAEMPYSSTLLLWLWRSLKTHLTAHQSLHVAEGPIEHISRATAGVQKHHLTQRFCWRHLASKAIRLLRRHHRSAAAGDASLAQGTVSSIQAVMASALVLGCATASITLWYFSQRYVGELSLLKSSAGRPVRLRFSVLDFCGNREVRRSRQPANLQLSAHLLPSDMSLL